MVALWLFISRGGSLVSLCSNSLGVQLFSAPCIFSLFSPDFRLKGALVLQLKSIIVENLSSSRGIAAVDVFAIGGNDPYGPLLGEGGA
jgi:hypothetical protein